MCTIHKLLEHGCKESDFHVENVLKAICKMGLRFQKDSETL